MRSAGVVRAVLGSVVACAAMTDTMGCGSAGNSGGNGAAGEAPVVGGGDFEPTAAAAAGDPFARVVEWPVSAGVLSSTQGQLVSASQVDVYDIGQVFTGDRVRVEALGAGGVNLAVALLDAEHAVLITNDDRSFYGGLTNPYAEAIVGHDSESCYVAVSVSPNSSDSGAYTLEVRLIEEDPTDEADVQYVYLDFDGADNVVIGTRPPVDVPAFDAAVIDADLATHNDEIIENLVSFVRDDFAGLNVYFLSSRQGPPLGEPYSTVHFGAYDPELLGVAENVDEYNELLNQRAIVFVDTFAAFATLNPSVEEIARALANVTSHEVGHLLGLYHTRDPRGIMDITANLRQMLGDQSFALSPLHEEVFPVGYQDGLRTLTENVGGDLAVAKSAATTAKAMRPSWYDEGQGRSARSYLTFGTCPLHATTASGQ